MPTLFLFVEPVALSTKLRRLRLALPIPVSGTPDERPLEYQDLAIIEGVLGPTKKQYFQALGRLSHFLGSNYELGSVTFRWIYDLFSRIDRFLIGSLKMKNLASVVVLTAQPGLSGRSRSNL